MLENLIMIVGQLSPTHNDAVVRLLNLIETTSTCKVVNVYINSAGGDSNTSTSIYLKLKDMKEKGWTVLTYGDSNVKSGALLIFLSGERRFLFPKTKLMYHQHRKEVEVKVPIVSPKQLVDFAKSNNFFQEAKTIEKNNGRIDSEIISITGISQEKLDGISDQDFDCAEAIEMNFATEIKYQ